MITIEAAKLSAAIKLAASVVESRNTIPILANVALSMIDGKLQLAATNLDMEFSQSVEVVSGDALCTSVDARRFASLVGAVPNGSQVSLEMGEGHLLVRAGRGRWRLPSLPLDDFPRISPKDLSAGTQIPGHALAELFGSVLWSVSNEVARPYLSGPLLHGEACMLSLVSTNGHTLVHQSSEVEWPEHADETIIAPKFAGLLERLCGDFDGQVDLRWDNARVEARIGDVTLIGKAIDGTFPDWRRVIPADQETPMLVEPERMVQALKQAMLVHSEKTRAARLVPGNEQCTIVCTSPDSGASEFEVSVDSPLGFESGFNGDYLASALNTVGGDTVEIHQAEQGCPTLIKRTVGDAPRCVVMPMRI